MTEDRSTYTATADPPDDQVDVKDAVLTLAGQVDDMRHRLDRIQDANLGPVLESSALLVELRRIADTLEDLRSDVTFSPPEPAPTHDCDEIADALEARNAVIVHNVTSSADACDCDELWRLARRVSNDFGKRGTRSPSAISALVTYVRQQTP